MGLAAIALNEEPEFLFKYFAYWVYLPEKTRNPKFDTNCSYILDLKKDEGTTSRNNAIKFFTPHILKLTDKNVVVCVVPSSDPKKTNCGVNELINIPIKKGLWIDGTDCLVRTKKVSKAATGGPRSVQIHMDSIEVKNKTIIKGKDVFLIDDVSTTGSSLNACKKLLLKAGAKSVQIYALGKTHWE